VGHANTNARVDEFLDKCLDKVVHVHLYDNYGKKDGHLPAGQGTVDLEKSMSCTISLHPSLVSGAYCPAPNTTSRPTVNALPFTTRADLAACADSSD